MLSLAHAIFDEVREKFPAESTAVVIDPPRKGSTPEFLEQLLIESDDPEIMEKAIFALSQIGDERAMQALKSIALDKSRPDEVRSQAIFWLGQAGGLDDVEFLKDLYGQIDDDEMKEAGYIRG